MSCGVFVGVLFGGDVSNILTKLQRLSACENNHYSTMELLSLPSCT